MTSRRGTAPDATRGRARRDLIASAILVAAILLFVATGGSVLSAIGATLTGNGTGADRTLTIALLLNIALVLFGWRHYRDLSREVEERAAAEARANQLASHDPLTDCLNRRSLAEAGAELLGRADRRDKDVAVLMIDLDHFKTVNDMNGHATGDALIRLVAQEMTGLLPPGALIARFGGDEFACAFLFDRSAPAVVERVADRLVARLARPFDADGTRLHISASVGIAHSGPDRGSFDALVRRADIAMYQAKTSGRNRYCWFDMSMEEELHSRNAIEMGLRAAIPAGRIVPYFEQQIDLATGRLYGFEVLARWIDPVRGIVMPDEFIPVAEETGLIGELSTSVMRQAFLAARDWDGGITLSVNISPTQLRDPYLAQKIVRLLVETGFPPQRLEVEITESCLFENIELARSIVISLKNQGIRIALDDFGTGYSSLAHLRALPFDQIKIDRSFVTNLNDNVESAAIVNAIAKLGESLNLPVTAEGIEDRGVQDRLIALGCAKGQGWHFGKPVDAAAARVMVTGGIQPPAAEVNSLRRAG